MERLERISTGFTEAKILLTAADLGVFDQLKGEGKSADEVCSALDGDPRGVRILLDALCAMEILSLEDGRYRLRPEVAPHLTEDATDHFPSMLRHRNRMFRRWAHLEERVLGVEDRPPTATASIRDDPRGNESFIRAMYAVGHRSVPEVVDHIDLGGVGSVADVGGGPAHYLSEFLLRCPEARGFLVDLPPTLEVAGKLLANSPLMERVRFVSWDIYAGDAPEELPPVDLVFLSHIVHQEGENENRALMRRLHQVVSPGGRLVVREFLLDVECAMPAVAPLFAVNMLAMTERGRAWTGADIAAWGEDAGFRHERTAACDERTGLVFLRRES
jgi:SAM-dependent methyltransferase